MTSRRPWAAALVASRSGANANATTAAIRQSWFRIDLGRETPADRFNGSDPVEQPWRPRSGATYPAGSDEAGGISRAGAGISKVGARVAYLSSKPNSNVAQISSCPGCPASIPAFPTESLLLGQCDVLQCLAVHSPSRSCWRTACNPAARAPSPRTSSIRV